MKTITTAILCSFFYFVTTAAHAQQSSNAGDDSKHRYLGLGIRVAGIQVNDLTSTAYPTNKIVLSVDPAKYFRVEGQLGIYSKITEHAFMLPNGGSDKEDLHAKSTFIGFGIMGMYPKDKARFIAGIRYGVNKYSDEDFVSSPSVQVLKNNGKMGIISGVIGGEYLLTSFFSLGADFSVSSVKDEYNPAADGSESTTSKALLSEGSLVIKFYPF